MKKLLRTIYLKIRDLPVIGALAQQLLAFVRNRNQGATRAVNWEQAQQVGSLAERLEVVEQLVKAQANAIAGLNNASKNLKREQLELKSELGKSERHQSARTEFVRDEIMFELRKVLKLKPSAAPGEAAKQATIPARILAHVQLGDQPVRINVGCGHIPHPDKLNVDVRELPGVDIVSGAENLPFEPDTVELIYAAHLLEHFPRRYLLDVLLPHWHSLLKSDGTLQLVVPDSQAMLASYQRGEMSFDTFAEVTFGKQDYDGDFHYAMYSPDTLSQLLREAGFEHLEVLATGRVNGDCREMEVTARKLGA